MEYDMPQLLQHIDAIAREKNRDVLFLHFENFEQDDQGDDPIRSIVLAWLEDHDIAYQPCMGLEQEGFVDTYSGDIYIDLPLDETDPTYQKLSEYLEDDEGNMMLDGVLFYVLSLETALDIEADALKQSDDNEGFTGKPS